MWTDLARWFRSLRGRLFAVTLVIVAAVVGGVVGYSRTAPYYSTAGAVVVMPAGAGSPDAGQNPFVNLYYSVQFTSVVSTDLQSEATRDRVATASGARPDYVIATVAREVRANFAQNSAQIEYTINAPSPEAAKRGADTLVAAARDAIATVQKDAGVPAERWAKLHVAVPPSTPQEITGGLVIAAITDGVIAALVAVALLIGWGLLRRLRTGRGAGLARLSLRSHQMSGVSTAHH